MRSGHALAHECCSSHFFSSSFFPLGLPNISDQNPVNFILDQITGIRVSVIFKQFPPKSDHLGHCGQILTASNITSSFEIAQVKNVLENLDTGIVIVITLDTLETYVIFYMVRHPVMILLFYRNIESSFSIVQINKRLHK